MLTNNSDVISEYKSLSGITLAKVRSLLESTFNISDRIANTMIALSALEAGGFYKNNYGDYLWDYYGAMAQINYTLNHTGSMYNMSTGDTPLLCPSYYSSGIMVAAWNNALGQDNLRFVYIAASNYTPYIISFCGADDDASDAGGSYGFTTSSPHLTNSDGGIARPNSSGQNIYTWITSNAKIESTSIYTSKHSIVQSYIKSLISTDEIKNKSSKDKNKYILKAFKPIFNMTYYYNKYPKILKKYKDNETKLFNHFINDGMGGNMQGCASFDITYYEQTHKNLQQKFKKNYPYYYIHYLKTDDKPKAYLYKDVPADDKHFSEIQYITNKNIMNGNEKGYFKGSKELTKSDGAYYLWVMAGKPNPSVSFNSKTNPCPYTDCYSLSTNKKKAILWCYEKNILKGYSDNTFRPNNKLIKRTVALAYYKLAGAPSVSGTITGYNDISDKKGTTAYKAILWCINKKIFLGVISANKWLPKHKMTKEDLAVSMYNYLNN